jgi:hypothetical protein
MENWEAFQADMRQSNDEPPEPDPVDNATVELDEALAIAGCQHPSLVPFLEADAALTKRIQSEIPRAETRALLDRLFAAHADDHGFVERLQKAHEQSE